MKEARLRKWHRTAGYVLAVFIVVQALTGIALTIENVLGLYRGGILHDLHYRFDPAGAVYRAVLGLGLVWMAGTGTMIGMIVRRRMKKHQRDDA